MKIETGHNVRIQFELGIKDGDLIEKSTVDYVQGEGKIFPALERLIAGMTLGQEKRGELSGNEVIPESSLPTKDISRAEFPKDTKLDVGQVFAAKGPDGQPINFKVIQASADKVVVRFLHPLAGKDLRYHVKILKIEDPKTGRRVLAVPPPPALALGIDDLKEDP